MAYIHAHVQKESKSHDWQENWWKHFFILHCHGPLYLKFYISMSKLFHRCEYQQLHDCWAAELGSLSFTAVAFKPKVKSSPLTFIHRNSARSHLQRRTITLIITQPQESARFLKDVFLIFTKFKTKFVVILMFEVSTFVTVQGYTKTQPTWVTYWHRCCIST